jgi:putative colanic acid biosynthesis UDP-glucose lipid carrier transferase
LEKVSFIPYALTNAVLLVAIVFAYSTAADSNWFTQRRNLVDLRNSLRQTAFFAGFLSILWIGNQSVSRSFLFSFFPVLFLTLAGTHRLLPSFLRKLSFGMVRTQRIILAGPCQNVSSLQGWLSRKQQVGYSLMGLLCPDRSPREYRGFKILGAMEDLEPIIIEQDITHVMLFEYSMFRHLLAHYAEVCDRHGVRLLVVCDFERALRHPVMMFEDEGIRFLGLRDEPLEDPVGRFAKRCLDITVALPVILFILPFTTLLVFLIQWRHAPGPIFYRQVRSGLQNIPFAIYKYRTMHATNPNPEQQATADDPRIYAGGHWLRKLSIDELPQFINVLRGEMSVVGPRPHLLEHDEHFAQALSNYPVRGNVKPGITGLAQVRGFRGETKTIDDITQRVESDIQYLENWSFLMDCWIILRTAVQVVFPPKTAV